MNLTSFFKKTKKKRFREQISVYLNLTTVVIALVSLAVAVGANFKSTQANRIAIEANEIAREANQIAVFETSPSLKLALTPWVNTIYTCKNPNTGTYLDFNRVTLSILISNLGGTGTSIIKLEGRYPSNDGWPVRIFEETTYFSPIPGESSFSSPVELPIDIAPGTSKRLYAVAFDLLGSGPNLSDINNTKEVPSGEREVFHWEIEFSNGDRFESNPSFGFYFPPNVSAEEECIYYHPQYP